MAIAGQNAAKRAPTYSAATDELMDRILLDIKALMILGASQGSLNNLIEEKISSSRDPQISAFVSQIASKKKKPESIRGTFLIAIGEMVLAAILSILGLALFAPSVTGLSSPQQITSYFAEIFAPLYSSQSTLTSGVVPAGEFILAILLLVGAFYNLRTAASNLKSTKDRIAMRIQKPETVLASA